jgi:hypothetical protein
LHQVFRGNVPQATVAEKPLKGKSGHFVTTLRIYRPGCAQESLMRLESPNIAQELLKVISGKA